MLPTLPARPAEHLAEGPAESLMGIGDDQVDSAQAPADEAPEKVQPEFARLARPHVEAQDLTVPLFSDPHSHHDGHGDHPAILAYPHRLGIQCGFHGIRTPGSA